MGLITLKVWKDKKAVEPTLQGQENHVIGQYTAVVAVLIESESLITASYIVHLICQSVHPNLQQLTGTLVSLCVVSRIKCIYSI